MSTGVLRFFSSPLVLAAGVGLLFFCIAPATINSSIPNDINTGYYASYGRNLIRYAPAQTHVMNFDAVGPGTPEALFSPSRYFKYYIDHPMLLTWLAAVALKLGAGSLLAARSVSILSSAGLVALLGMWISRRLGTYAALVGMMAMLMTRVFWIHGVVLNFEPLTAFLVFAALSFFTDGFFGSAGRSSIVLGCLFWFLAMLADWPAYFLAVPVAWYFARERRWLAMVGSLLIPVWLYMGVMTYYGINTGDPWLAVHFLIRTFQSEIRVHKSSWTEVAGAVFWNGGYNFGAMPAFAIAGTFVMCRRGRTESNDRLFMLLALGCVGILNILLFRQWAHDHTFWSYYFLPAIGLGAAEVASKLKFDGLNWQNALFTFGIILGFLNLIPVPNNLQFGVPFRVELPWHDDVDLLARSELPYYGQGYIARWYLDRPLIDAGMVISGGLPCRPERSFFVMRDDEWEQSSSMMKELFAPVKAFHWMVLPIAAGMKSTGLSCEEALKAVSRS